MTNLKRFSILLLASLFAGAFAQQTLKVGVSPVPHAAILEAARPLLAAQGIELEIVEFTDYVQPNLALASGDLDANYFQHVPYLEQFSADHNLELSAIAGVHVEPIGLYSSRHATLADLPDGALLAIPNDPTNGGRALLLLQAAGLLELTADAGLDATILDIAENPRKLRFSELEAAQLPRALQDVAAAVINTNYALEADLNPAEDALVIEDARSPYTNVLAVQTARADEPALLALAAALNSAEVREFIEQEYGGAIVPAF
jgi:D-methionine transport system substrate-binding protein